MEPHRQQRANVAIKAFHNQVRMLAAVVEALTAGLERATSGEAEPETVDLAALVNRLEEVNPVLAVLAEDVRAKAVAAFGKPLPSDNAASAKVHSVRNGLHAVTMYSSVLKEQLAKLEAAQPQGTALPVDLDTLGTAAQAMGRELANWSREIEVQLRPVKCVAGQP